MQFFFVIMQSYLDDGSTRDPWLAKKRFLPPLSTCLGDDATYPCRISLLEANLELHRHLPILAHSVTVKDRWILDNCTLFFFLATMDYCTLGLCPGSVHSLLLIVNWEIWKVRNSRTFQQKEQSTLDLVQKMKEAMTTWVWLVQKFLAALINLWTPSFLCRALYCVL
jgi:hypothetical protein